MVTHDTIFEGDEMHLARAVRDACMKAAVEAYEEAGIRGLCHEGAWEYAIDAIRQLNVKQIINGIPTSSAI